MFSLSVFCGGVHNKIQGRFRCGLGWLFVACIPTKELLESQVLRAASIAAIGTGGTRVLAICREPGMAIRKVVLFAVCFDFRKTIY